jgi:large-conductance mechanosensitive channel
MWVDLAVGIILGAAFGAIVQSAVASVEMGRPEETYAVP